MRTPIYPKAPRRDRSAGKDFLDAAQHIEPPSRAASAFGNSAATSQTISTDAALSYGMQPEGPAGKAVVTIFDAVQQMAPAEGWFAASAVIGRSLREDRKLHSRERRHVGDTVHAMLHKLRRLRTLLRQQESRPAKRSMRRSLSTSGRGEHKDRRFPMRSIALPGSPGWSSASLHHVRHSFPHVFPRCRSFQSQSG